MMARRSAGYKFNISGRGYSVWCEFEGFDISSVKLCDENVKVIGCVSDLEACKFKHWFYLVVPTEFKAATQGSGRDLGPFVEKVLLRQNGNAWILTIDPYNVLASASGGGLTVNGRTTREISFTPA